MQTTNKLFKAAVNLVHVYAKRRKNDLRRRKLCTYSASQHTQSSLMNIHDGVVLSFVAVHFLRNNKTNTIHKH